MSDELPSMARVWADQCDRRERLDFENLDEGIRWWVKALWEMGVETVQSCEGGPGHAYAEPTIEFRGPPSEGHRALSLALLFGQPVSELRRVWSVENGEPVGPHWALTYRRKWEVESANAADMQAHGGGFGGGD